MSPEIALSKPKIFAKQEGGNHYKKFKIEPAYYNWVNKIGWIEGECIKYLSRWQDKGGVADIRKAIHLQELLIYFETTPMELVEQSKVDELNRLMAESSPEEAGG